MTPYILLLSATALLGYFLCQRGRYKHRDLLFLGIVGAAMLTMVALRNAQVGIDYLYSYKNYFLLSAQRGLSFAFSAENGFRKEFGYWFLNYFVSLFTKDPMIFAAVTSALIIVLRLVAIYRMSSSVWISVYVYISFGLFMYSMCTYRQELGVSIFLFALPYLQNKKPIPYLLITLLATTVHFSFLIMIPLYFIAWWPLNKYTTVLYAGGTLGLIIFSEAMLGFLATHIDRLSSYQPGSYFLEGRGFNVTFMPLVFMLTVILLRKRILKRNPNNLPLVNMFIYSGLLFLMVMKHFIFQRVALIFIPVGIFLLPEVILSLKPDAEKYKEIAATTDKHLKKQLLQKHGELKALYEKEYSLFVTVGTLILVGCALYQLYLLQFNGLRLTPYMTIFQEQTIFA